MFVFGFVPGINYSWILVYLLSLSTCLSLTFFSIFFIEQEKEKEREREGREREKALNSS